MPTVVGVVGLGTMGAGIAEVFSRHGFDVVGIEADAEALNGVADTSSGPSAGRSTAVG